MDEMTARFDRLQVQFEKSLDESWSQHWSHLHKLWDHEQAKKEMADSINLLYNDTRRKTDVEIASAEERVKQEEMALKALRGKHMAPEDEIKNAVILLMKARRELDEKRNVWATKRAIMDRVLNMMVDEQDPCPGYPWTNQAP